MLLSRRGSRRRKTQWMGGIYGIYFFRERSAPAVSTGSGAGAGGGAAARASDDATAGSGHLAPRVGSEPGPGRLRELHAVVERDGGERAVVERVDGERAVVELVQAPCLEAK